LVNGPTKPDRLCPRGGAPFTIPTLRRKLLAGFAIENNACGSFVAAARSLHWSCGSIGQATEQTLNRFRNRNSRMREVFH
jgi:hypothetical protein